MPRTRDPIDPIVLDDRGLSVAQLQAKHGAQHPVFTQVLWEDAIARRRTLDDYWGWVEYHVCLNNENE
ncbi:hypothetical protein [Variovorax ginsengisoli]|uniref:Uncharacterized protein n=1 Tax=Variovorax ginsengisoli TaxID=363844 RepID=A0ABT9S2P3_9BURK|nr:hypothetical protein [Variovorax ginsengisoli]MDP9898628.1 hypothetical protein [Variovorax ginsengisoli]